MTNANHRFPYSYTSRCFHFRIFHHCIFYRADVSTPAFSAPPSRKVRWRSRCPESGFIRTTENSINMLAVSGCGKAPPSRSGISDELRNDDRAEHLLQSRHRHPVRPQDADGVHGPRRRADDIVHSTCTETDSLSVNVTPRLCIFSDVTRAMPCIIGGGVEQRRFRLSRKISSTVFDAFNVRLLTLAHASMLARQ